MNKQKKLLTLVLVLALLLVGTVSMAAAPAITPQAALVYGANLTVKSYGLQEEVYISYNTSQTTIYSVTLQQKSGTSWVDCGSTYYGSGSGMGIVYSTTVDPANGYYYRLKVNMSSTDFPNVLFYSNQTWY